MEFAFHYFCILTFIKSCMACEINADNLVIKDTILGGQQFWAAPAADTGVCAKACLRLKMSASFNFNIVSNFCELSSDTAENKTHLVSHILGIVYSDITYWPATVSSLSFSDCNGYN